ncbi:hypothetical protein ACHAWF_009431 [Thalassiosira exigua]
MGGRQISKNDKLGTATGYHFHNFFQSNEAIHKKYLTYGHSLSFAMERPIWNLSSDMASGVRCSKNVRSKGGGALWATESFHRASSEPIWYQNQQTRTRRHSLWQQIVSKEEERFGAYTMSNSNRNNAKDAESDRLESDGEDIVRYLHEANQNKTIPPYVNSNWEPSNSAVLGIAVGLPLSAFRVFIGSLRCTGYRGKIILGISPDSPQEVLDYLRENEVTIQVVEMATACTYSGSLGYSGGQGKILNTENWHCPLQYPAYKITWARFPLYKDWLNQCAECTGGILLTDVRDSYWQRDPFITAGKLKMQHSLMLFEEIFPALDTTHWLTDFPIDNCKKSHLGKQPMLCSGSVMGSREGVISYINAMVREFDMWLQDEHCRIDMIGDDQAVHNWLFYTNQLNAVAIPYRTGPIHVAGWIANRMWTTASEQSKEINGTQGAANFYVRNDNYKEWLPQKYNFIDPETGFILNNDGSPSAQVHQGDRFGTLNLRWLQKMKEQNWPYNNEL